MNDKQFKYSKSERIGYAFGTLFFFGLIFFLRNNPELNIWSIMILLGFGLVSLIAFFKSLATITLTGTSIIQKYPFVPEKEIQLKDVYSVAEFNDSSKFVLKDFSDNSLLTINKTIVGIQELKKEVKAKLVNTMKVKPQEYFRKSNNFFISYFGMVLLMMGTFGLFLYQKNELAAVVSLLFSIFIFYMVGKQPIFIYLSNSHITIRSMFNAKQILMTEITGIIQETDDKTKSGSVTYTVFKLFNGKDISLSGFKPDDELMFQSCIYYFNNKIRAT